MPETKTGYPSIDKPWLQFYKEEELSVPPVNCTIYERMYQYNKDFPHDTALEFFGHKIAYGTLFEEIDKCKKSLETIGINAGDKAVLLTSSTPETVYLAMALCRIGAVIDLINPLFTEQQIIDRTNETKAEVMFVLDQLYGKIEGIKQELCIKKYVVIPIVGSMSGITKLVARMKLKKSIPYSDSVITWKNFISEGKGKATKPDKPYEKDYPLIMVYSSGTTGASKGIVLTNDGANATISHYYDTDFPFTRKDVFLQIVPVWFSTGLILSLFMPLCLGITTVIEPVFSKENFAKDLLKYKPNMMIGATSLWRYVMTCDEMKNADLSFMTYPITGGELMLHETEIALNEFLKAHGCKAPLIKGYGMCELGSTVSTSSPTHSKPGSMGYPISHVSVAAFDIDTNEEKKYMERGEIRVLSPAHMKEYYSNPKATEEFFYKDKDGNVWGCTGDYGYIDEDGDIYILGRANDYFCPTVSERVFCFDVENVILSLDEIDQCEVLGIDNGDGTHKPFTHVILSEKCTLSQDEVIAKLKDICSDNLPSNAIPKAIKIVKDFPVKPSGKRDIESMKADTEGMIEI